MCLTPKKIKNPMCENCQNAACCNLIRKNVNVYTIKKKYFKYTNQSSKLYSSTNNN